MASLASCQLLIYLALARGAGVALRRYEDRPKGTLALVERRMRMTQVLLRPRLVLAARSDEDEARTLVERGVEAEILTEELEVSDDLVA